jgi:tRNA (uracil-5-)-methyltransferase
MSGEPVDEPVAKRQCVEAAAADAEPAAPPDAAEAAQDGLAGGTLIVRPLPKHWDVDKLRSLLSSAGVKVASIRKKKSWPYAFLTFGFLADRVHAEAAVPKLRAEGRPLSTADASQREGGGAPAKGAKADATAEAAARATRDVRDAVSPLWAVPYEQQLQRKRATVAAALQQLSRSTKKASQGKPPQWAFGGGLACPLRGIVASPVRDCYRNKCEFSIGPCGETGLLSIGFNVGAFAEGYAAVASGERCPHVSPAARQVAAWTQAHLRATSALPFWDKRAGGGFWRLLMVREGGMALRSGAGWRNWLVTDTAELAPDAAAEPPLPPAGWEGQPVPRDGAEVLCVVQVSPAGHAAETVRAECAALAAALQQAAAAAHPPMPLGALLLQVHTGCSNAAPADAPLMPLDAYSEAPGGRSDGALHERLFDLRFRISPEYVPPKWISRPFCAC